MAQVDCEPLMHLSQSAARGTVAIAAASLELDLPSGVASGLATRAAAHGGSGAPIDAAALAALPASGGGFVAAGMQALLGRARSQLQAITATRRVGVPPPAVALANAGASAQVKAQAQAAAVEAAVRTSIAAGDLDPRSLSQVALQAAGPPPAAAALAPQMAAIAQARVAALEAQIRAQLLPSLPVSTADVAAANPATAPVAWGEGVADHQRTAASHAPLAGAPPAAPWEAITSAPTAASGGGWSRLRVEPSTAEAALVPAPSAAAATALVASSWRRVPPGNPESADASGTDLPLPALVGGQGLSTYGASTRWQRLLDSLPATQLPTAPPPVPWSAAPGGTLAPPAWPLPDPAGQFSGVAVPQVPHLPPPTVDPAAMAGVASAATLFRGLFGRSLGAPGALSDLAETIESFDECLEGAPAMNTDGLARLGAWGALARSVAEVRTRMGVDLLQPGMGEAWARALMQRHAAAPQPPAAWELQRAGAVGEWLVVDQAATALGLPVAGAGALRRLGAGVRELAGADLGQVANLGVAASLLSLFDSLQLLQAGLGVDLLRPDAVRRLGAAGQRVWDNLGGRTTEEWGEVPPLARGLTHSALARFTRIDRAQAGDLGLQDMDGGGSAMCACVPAILATIKAARAVSGRRITRPGRGRPRRPRQ